ncbi:MAG: outer membrane protein assembly factor BamD [Candidatus Neomarinimicrobiota bacterium]
MTRLLSFVLVVYGGLLLPGCAGGDGQADAQGDIEEHFARGQALFEREKWARAAEEFNWVVLNNPAGNLAAEAQFFYAECLYQQRLYVEAQIEFERLLRRWATTEHLVEARYRIVQALVAQSPNYYFDQRATDDAIDELQDFIEEFPDAPQREEAEGLIGQLRGKIAQKYYESGRLYLKWHRPSPARVYFEMVLAQYYDTPFADEARVGTVVSYILAEDMAAAEAYLEENVDKFQEAKLLSEARHFITIAREGKFDLAFYLRLYQ